MTQREQIEAAYRRYFAQALSDGFDAEIQHIHRNVVAQMGMEFPDMDFNDLSEMLDSYHEQHIKVEPRLIVDG
jgi:hypothetical protein